MTDRGREGERKRERERGREREGERERKRERIAEIIDYFLQIENVMLKRSSNQRDMLFLVLKVNEI